MGNLWQKSIAAHGEQAAARFFEEKGGSVIKRNWRWGRFAEIDLIVRDLADLLIFVEVKTRQKIRMDSGFPESGFDTINWRKRQKIVTSARCFVAVEHLSPGQPMRFDVVLVEFSDKRDLINCNFERLALTHVPSAFSS
jgi:uncharacterized protein (TIGR00252 family)